MNATGAATAPDGPSRPLQLVTEPPGTPEQVTGPMPRLGRGLVWSEVVAEIERDRLTRERDAA